MSDQVRRAIIVEIIEQVWAQLRCPHCHGFCLVREDDLCPMCEQEWKLDYFNKYPQPIIV